MGLAIHFILIYQHIYLQLRLWFRIFIYMSENQLFY
jgi:hypothetical protein